MKSHAGYEVARVELARADLMSRARAGDGGAFRALTEPHRRELQVHCYRMLGSFHDAEDALQESMLAAWRGLDGFDGRASLRTWLYRIATNRCLDALRAVRRRPAKEWGLPELEPPEPTGLGEIHWLEPFPDALLDGAINGPLAPEARFEQVESLRLAFVTALQALPPRQLAVLILRDVLGFHADEVADMLGTTVESIKSALKRARAGLQGRLPATTECKRLSGGDSAAEDVIVAKFVSAYESADVDALVALLTDDIFLSMPPMPLEYRGRDSVGRFFAFVFGLVQGFRLLPTRANGQPAFGVYRHTPEGMQGIGLFVLTLAGERISALTRFEDKALAAFGLPPLLASAQ
jgi:RNA polymerase sigma-70 factor (ECF subfamily)